MPGFDITPPDPAGAQQDWLQTLARTLLLKGQTKQAPLNTQLMQQHVQQNDIALQNAQHKQLQQLAFEKEVAALPETLPLFEKASGAAMAAIRTGNFDHAEKLMGLMSQQQNRESLIEQRAEKARAMATKEKLDKLKRAEELVSGATDQETWRAANEVFKTEFGEESPFAGRLYTPALAKALRQALGKRSTDLQDQLTAEQIKALKVREGKDNKLTEVRTRLEEARIKELESRIERGTKTGGKTATASAVEVKQAQAKIAALFPGMSKMEMGVLSGDVAEDAKAIHNAEHGSFADALDKAVESRRAQISEKVEKGSMPWSDEKRTPTYSPRKPAAAAAPKPGGLPAGIPPNSRPIGKTPQGKTVYQAPDGKRYAED